MGCERVASFVPRMRRRPGRSCSCVMGLRDGEVQGSGPSVGMRRERRGEVHLDGRVVQRPRPCVEAPGELHRAVRRRGRSRLRAGLHRVEERQRRRDVRGRRCVGGGVEERRQRPDPVLLTLQDHE